MAITQKHRYVEVKERLLKEEILNKTEDERLPSRTELIEKYGVTRTTIERAISELIGEGYLYAHIGSGTYIAPKRQIFHKTGSNGSVMNWGVILPDILEDIYPGILRGIEDITSEHGINVIVCNSDGHEDKQNKYILQLIDSGISGLIIVPSFVTTNSNDVFNKLKEEKIPCVFCNRIVPGIEAPLVTSNSFYGGYIATRHLIETGRRKIAFISVPFYQIAYERFAGYKAALTEAGIQDRHEYHAFETEFFGSRLGYESAKKLLSLEEQPDAIFCLTDFTARGAYEAITEAGLTVGKDIAVIGYDNTDICDLLPVKLSSVKFRQYEIGKRAAEILLQILQKEKPADFALELFQPELIIRNSTERI